MDCRQFIVAPFAGARIEILFTDGITDCNESLPSRERGLKLLDSNVVTGISESLPSRERGLKCIRMIRFVHPDRSLPSRERGLKLQILATIEYNFIVAPFAGARIEIRMIWHGKYKRNCRSLRGSAD